jgi:hypothetical protein
VTAATTVSVTGTTTVPEDAVMVMLPVYDPAVNPLASILTETDAGVGPLVGGICSQLPELFAAMVNEMGPPVLVMDRV